MHCPNCGGEVFGDGDKTVMVCENLSDGEYVEQGVAYAAPDEGPFYCSFEE